VGRRYVLGGRVCMDAGERPGRGLVRIAMASRRRHNCSNSAQPIGRQSNRSPNLRFTNCIKEDLRCGTHRTGYFQMRIFGCSLRASSPLFDLFLQYNRIRHTPRVGYQHRCSTPKAAQGAVCDCRTYRVLCNTTNR